MSPLDLDEADISSYVEKSFKENNQAAIVEIITFSFTQLKKLNLRYDELIIRQKETEQELLALEAADLFNKSSWPKA